MKKANLADGLVLIATLLLLHQYLQWNGLNFMLGVPALWLFWTQASGNHLKLQSQLHLPLFIVLLLLLVLTIVKPVQTLLYLSVLVYFMSRSKEDGKKGLGLLFFTVILMSPLAEYFFSVFSFPLRLWLSKFSVAILHSVGEPVKAIGNLIEVNGKEFSVDTACMGMNLTTASLMCGLLLLLVMQNKLNRSLSFTWLLGYLILVFCFNVLANLIRIMLLVKLQIFPENYMHEVLGLLSLLVYVCFPAWWLVKLLLSRIGRMNDETIIYHQTNKVNAYFVVFLKIAFWMLFLIAGWNVKDHTEISKPYETTVQKSTQLEGFAVTSYSSDVLKLTNPNELVYIKTIPDFFTPEHSPMICWRGSGYELNKISELDLGSFKCYTAELVQGKQKLFTAWWFSNGEKHTNSQLAWRWHSFRSGSRYCLVNYTVASQQELKQGIIQLLKVKGFRTLLDNSEYGTALSRK